MRSAVLIRLTILLLFLGSCRSPQRIDPPAKVPLVYLISFDGGHARHLNLALKQDIPAPVRNYPLSFRNEVVRRVTDYLDTVKGMVPFKVILGRPSNVAWATKVFVTDLKPIIPIRGQLAHFESDYGDSRKDDEVLVFDSGKLSATHLAWLIAHELGHAIGFDHSSNPHSIMNINPPLLDSSVRFIGRTYPGQRPVKVNMRFKKRGIRHG